MRVNTKYFLLLCVLSMGTIYSPASNAAEIHALSCSGKDMQAAIDRSSSGDTILVPAGSCSWTADLYVPNSKKLTLRGAGIDKTIVTNPLSTGVTLNLGDSGSRLTGFTFNEIHLKLFMGNSRIDHNKFYTATTSPGSGVLFTSSKTTPYRSPEALVDHNVFYNCRVVVYGGVVLAHTQWTIPHELGTGDNTVYIEDNEFFRTYNKQANVVDGSYGGSYVFRYNILHGINAGINVMAHSIQSTYNRALKKWEFYGNVIHTDTLANVPFFLRGGTGVVFFNSVTGRWGKKKIGVDNVRSSLDIGGNAGMCDGTSVWDGNEDATGYPCRDQIGMGHDATLWSDNPAGPYRQVHAPAYGWLNRTEANAEVPFYVLNVNSAQHIRQNRDFYDYSASFDGTSGVGAGTLSERPKNCTPGVAYWATNQNTETVSGMVGPDPSQPIDGILYKCTAPNTWTEYFKPYPYPHPLSTPDSMSMSDSQSMPDSQFIAEEPTPPQNLMIH